MNGTVYYHPPAEFSQMKKVVIGSGYLVLSLLGTCLNLSTLSVLPECEKSLTRPLLIFSSIQLFTGIGTLLSVAIPVPYMIATNRPYFMNPLIAGAPGGLICITLIVLFLIQFCICFYRSIRVAFSTIAQLLFPDLVVEILIGITFILAVNACVEITRNTEARRFSLEALSWRQTQREYMYMLTLIVYSSMMGLMFYALSFFDLLYEHIYEKEKYETAESTPKIRLLYQIFHLICDVIFCSLIVLPQVENPSTNPNLAITHSLLNIFGPAVWPTISLIVYSERVRHTREEQCWVRRRRSTLSQRVGLHKTWEGFMFLPALFVISGREN
ncbi:hypothetical protein GCK32_003524 [Trichostrongylus colubriformis]|uniref:Uncharacterized protein n=1 Tax=Trichostrongylus colubriformis TaxID=6319 RepID=A0AAN8FDU5_TRICO